MATSFDASTGIATATIPDDGSVGDGTHNLRAIVRSVAGTQAAISQAATGILGQAAPAAVTLPLRIVTQLNVGQTEAIATKCVVRRTVLHEGRHSTTKLTRVCSSIPVPHSSGTLKLSYGQRATVSGLLDTVDGDPVPQAQIDISQQATGSWPTQTVGTIQTNSSGTFTYTIPAGPSRTLTFTYPGTATTRPSSTNTSVEAAGKITLALGRTAIAGHDLRFSGQVYGGYIPAGGASVQLQYRAKGSPVGWEPFGNPVNTNSDGRWSVTVRLYTGAAGYTYQFNALLGAQTGWPWTSATSNAVARHVARQ